MTDPIDNAASQQCAGNDYLTHAEASAILVAMTEMIGFSVEITRLEGAVRVTARSPSATVAVENRDGNDDACLHAALSTMADRIAESIDAPTPE